MSDAGNIQQGSYYIQSFWSPCRKYLVTVFLNPPNEMALVDYNGDQWEAAGRVVDVAASNAFEG